VLKGFIYKNKGDRKMTKRVLITGVNRGLGFALTELYLKKGFMVFGGLLNEPSEKI
jgi:NAD(P)-dependent dehydrogenase (short-subunit alcohol dehydrogenase family)